MMKDICENIRNKLSDHSQLELSQQAFDKISKCCFMNLVEDQNNTRILDQITEQFQDQRETVYELFNLLLLFTVECVSINLTESEIQNSLIDQGWSQQQADTYVKKYKQFRDFIEDPENALVSQKYQSTIPFNKLVDLDWQQEIVVASKYANKVYQEVYKMNLHVKNDKGQNNSIVFKCTLPQLIEINNKLGVLVKNIESSSDLKHLTLNEQQV